jgi:hypothetical protein
MQLLFVKRMQKSHCSAPCTYTKTKLKKKRYASSSFFFSKQISFKLGLFFFVSKPKIYRFDGQEDRQYLPDIAALLTSGSSMASCD